MSKLSTCWNVLTFPCRFRPVRPIRCTNRIGFLLLISKQTIKSTSPTSIPSSATHVAINVLHFPLRKSFIIAICSFCVIVRLCEDPWPFCHEKRWEENENINKNCLKFHEFWTVTYQQILSVVLTADSWEAYDLWGTLTHDIHKRQWPLFRCSPVKMKFLVYNFMTQNMKMVKFKF